MRIGSLPTTPRNVKSRPQVTGFHGHPAESRPLSLSRLRQSGWGLPIIFPGCLAAGKSDSCDDAPRMNVPYIMLKVGSDRFRPSGIPWPLRRLLAVVSLQGQGSAVETSGPPVLGKEPQQLDLPFLVLSCKAVRLLLTSLNTDS